LEPRDLLDGKMGYRTRGEMKCVEHASSDRSFNRPRTKYDSKVHSPQHAANHRSLMDRDFRRFHGGQIIVRTKLPHLFAAYDGQSETVQRQRPIRIQVAQTILPANPQLSTDGSRRIPLLAKRPKGAHCSVSKESVQFRCSIIARLRSVPETVPNRWYSLELGIPQHDTGELLIWTLCN